MRPRWQWWRKLSWLLGLLALAGALSPPLDAAGRDGSLVAHISQHLLLGDVAPLLLLLGLPPRARRAAAGWLASLKEANRGHRRRVLRAALSPVGALALWVVATYTWFLPPVHRAAVLGGGAHLADHASFLIFGLLLALAVFDPRPSNLPQLALLDGGMPWWGRHAYSMGSRLFMVPPAVVVLVSPSYAVTVAGTTNEGKDADRLNAATLMLGFEMVLFSLSFVLAFLFLAVSEGQRQEREARNASDS